MGKVKIVTDSTSYLEASMAKRLGITVVPLTVRLGEETFREGVDITAEEFFQKLDRSSAMPVAFPPSVEDFQAVYAKLSKTTDQIMSIHISSSLSQTCSRAMTASRFLLGRCQVTVVDSLTTSLGLGILATAAAQAAAQGQSLEEIEFLIRGMIPRIYIVFLAETLKYLEREGRIGRAQALLGAMLNIKPFLAIEDGEIIPMEKVRDREGAVDKLFEFVGEFSRIERMAIMQSTPEPIEETKMLIERLELTFPNIELPILVYGPVLACHIGPDGLGVIVYEGVEERFGG
ncbi:MAG: DegV family protein [Anaerolineales bacterium]|nr:DegV family protein [Anaerolineales bacterium]